MWPFTTPLPSEWLAGAPFAKTIISLGNVFSSLTEPPVPAAPVATTTTPAPASGNSNETTTTATTTTTTTPPLAGGRRRKRSQESGSYTSETVGPENVTSYKKLNVFEVTDILHKVHHKVSF